jgi:two-component system, OmpR family, sensor kinase
MKSFRSALALRVAVQALGAALVALVGAALYLRVLLLSNVDASLLEVAQLEAQFGVSQGSAEFRFSREPMFPTVGTVSAHQSWAQLIGADGKPLGRSSNLHQPLPVALRAVEAARRTGAAFVTHRWNSQTIRSAFYPLGLLSIERQGQVLQIATSLAPLEGTLNNFVWLMAGLGLLGTLLAGVVGYVIAGRALRPALALTAEAESIGVNELGRRVALPGDLAEFDRMAVTFNGLLERLEQAIKGTRRFTSDASHELRAPLTVLRGELELALSRPRTAEEYGEVLRRCLDEVLRLVRLADDLLTLTRIQGGVVGGKRVPVELDEVVERAVEKKFSLAESRGVILDVTGSAGLVSGDADLLVRAVDGLVEHAIMASPPGGRVRVRLVADYRRSVEVTDGGQGLKPDEISGVFQRFYRSNRPRVTSDESGLGLPIARAVALSHGGVLEYVGNDPGASFRLSLPASR